MNGRPPRDLTGQQFGRLTALERIAQPPDRAIWRCRCACGTLTLVSTSRLRNGATKSCGCWQREGVSARRKTHGACGNGGHHVTPEYTAWCAMKARCTNAKRRDWKDYGGRGITICEAWKNNFPAFLADVGPRPSASHSLDRFPNHDGNYEPGNVRWTTTIGQMNNIRRNRRVTFNGQTKTVAEWEVALGFQRDQIGQRLRHGWTVAEALSEPISKAHQHR